MHWLFLEHEFHRWKNDILLLQFHPEKWHHHHQTKATVHWWNVKFPNSNNMCVFTVDTVICIRFIGLKSSSNCPVYDCISFTHYDLGFYFFGVNDGLHSIDRTEWISFSMLSFEYSSFRSFMILFIVLTGSSCVGQCFSLISISFSRRFTWPDWSVIK